MTCLAREVFRNSGASICALATRLRFPLRFRFRGCRINREDPPGEPFDGGEVGQLNLAANKVCCRRQDLPRGAEHGHGTVAFQQRTKHQYYHERCRANAPRTHAWHAGMGRRRPFTALCISLVALNGPAGPQLSRAGLRLHMRLSLLACLNDTWARGHWTCFFPTFSV